MTIKTNVDGTAGPNDGHAWLEFKGTDGSIKTLSIWGNQGSQEFFANKELAGTGYDNVTSRTVVIYNYQIELINNFNSNQSNTNWTVAYTCAGYAATLWNNITFENLTASSYFGASIAPSSLALSIINANGGQDHN